MRIGFVGLGLMGLPIARHLAEAGHQLFVASGSRAPLDELSALGATVCESPRDIAGLARSFLPQAVIDGDGEQLRPVRKRPAPARREPHQRQRIRPPGHRQHQRRRRFPGGEQFFRLLRRDRRLVGIGHGSTAR